MFTFLAVSAAAEGVERLSDQRVRVRIMENEDVISFQTSGGFVLESREGRTHFGPGRYVVSARKVRAAKQRFHVFTKTFQPHDKAGERAYVAQWRKKGFSPKVVTVGRRVLSDSGVVLDGRVHWISVMQYPSEAGALAAQKRLEGADQWSWVHGETVAPGKGVLILRGAQGKTLGSFRVPTAIHAMAPVRVANVDFGFWDEQREGRSYGGTMEFEIGPRGGLDLIESLSAENYLQGVLPAEMPPLWPLEALKAQAVAARTEILSNLWKKHSLERFDFCAVEHCRAYGGADARHERSIAAIKATAGRILVQDGRAVPTVFSSNCGGWSEDNSTPWRAPEHRALRGVSDVVRPSSSRSPEALGMASWLLRPPVAFCSGDKDYYRWTRTFSHGELRDLLNTRYAVGDVRELQLGDRGIGGRLKWLRVIGSKKTETIHKELAIRLAFGGLPSALFILDVSEGPGPRTYRFIGGGRGHGVGLCQQGARGMALRGKNYEEILHHYFTDVTIERYR